MGGLIDEVFWIEVKNTFKQEYISQAKEKMKKFKELFPEYEGKS